MTSWFIIVVNLPLQGGPCPGWNPRSPSWLCFRSGRLSQRSYRLQAKGDGPKETGGPPFMPRGLAARRRAALDHRRRASSADPCALGPTGRLPSRRQWERRRRRRRRQGHQCGQSSRNGSAGERTMCRVTFSGSGSAGSGRGHSPAPGSAGPCAGTGASPPAAIGDSDEEQAGRAPTA